MSDTLKALVRYFNNHLQNSVGQKSVNMLDIIETIATKEGYEIALSNGSIGHLTLVDIKDEYLA